MFRNDVCITEFNDGQRVIEIKANNYQEAEWWQIVFENAGLEKTQLIIMNVKD